MADEVIQKNNFKNFWACRVAPSLGALEAPHREVWGTKDYIYSEDKHRPTVFHGLYDLRDYLALFFHRGEKAILWAGGDIENLISGFAFNDGKLGWLSRACRLAPRLLINRLVPIPNYVENKVEKAKLAGLGINSKVVPSFLGRFTDFPMCYEQSSRPNVFVSGHPGREGEYGFGFIERIAQYAPECIFHLYGADWHSESPNVVCHGKVPKEQFNKEIRGYQCGLRPNTHDGFSEITAKSILMGQHAITRIQYPYIDNYIAESGLIRLLRNLKDEVNPQFLPRDYYLKHLNQYPWNIYANTN